MGFILTVIGTLLLLASLVGIGFGAYMAADPKTSRAGKLFALWWVPVVAAASGMFMRDVVTFAVGVLCFSAAGAVFTFENGKTRTRRTRTPTPKHTDEKRTASRSSWRRPGV